MAITVTVKLKDVEEVHETDRTFLILCSGGQIVAIPKTESIEVKVENKDDAQASI